MDGDTSKRGTILSHLSELRGAVIRSLWVIVAVFLIAMGLSEQLMVMLQYPLRVTDYPIKLGFIEVTEPFVVSLRAAFLCSVVVTAPYWIHQIWRFVAPGLYLKEKRCMAIMLILSWLLFWLGAVFCFFVMLPITLNFLVNFGEGFASPTLTLKSYISFLSLLIIGFGLVFELPLIIIILAAMGLISAESLKAARRYVLLGCFIFSAFLTPPDWISQVGMAIPTYLLYELAVTIVCQMEKRVQRTKKGHEQDESRGSTSKSRR